jgi:hypothetical protein
MIPVNECPVGVVIMDSRVGTSSSADAVKFDTTLSEIESSVNLRRMQSTQVPDRSGRIVGLAGAGASKRGVEHPHFVDRLEDDDRIRHAKARKKNGSILAKEDYPSRPAKPIEKTDGEVEDGCDTTDGFRDLRSSRAEIIGCFGELLEPVKRSRKLARNPLFIAAEVEQESNQMPKKNQLKDVVTGRTRVGAVHTALRLVIDQLDLIGRIRYELVAS